MKTKHLTTDLNYNSSLRYTSSRGKTRKGAGQYEHSPSVSKQNCEYNNRPAKSVNFSGSASLCDDTAKIIQKSLNKVINEGVKEYKGIKKPGNFAYKIIDSDFFNKALRLVKNNEAEDGTFHFDEFRVMVALDFAKTEIEKAVTASE